MELAKSVAQSERDIRRVDTLQDRLVRALYGHMAGRLLLRPLTSPWFSKLGGRLLDTHLSALLVRPLARAQHIDLSQCEKQQFSSYNDFFTRKLHADARPVDLDPDAWISPCDAKLCVWPITPSGRFCIKHTPYTLEELLKNKALAKRYQGGYLWLFRLSVDDYHRYIFPVDARVSRQIRIPGVFHTVNPIANDHEPIYKENTREYCLLCTERFGTVLMMEVGAMLVGKIENRPAPETVRRGEEKGNFAFGGSTIILLSQAGMVKPEDGLLKNSADEIETKVQMGERVGERVSKV